MRAGGNGQTAVQGEDLPEDHPSNQVADEHGSAAGARTAPCLRPFWST